VEPGQGQTGLRIAAGSGDLGRSGPPHEGGGWLSAGAAVRGRFPLGGRAHRRRQPGVHAGRFPASSTFESLAIHRRMGDRQSIAYAANNLANAAVQLGDQRRCTTRRSPCPALGDVRGAALGTINRRRRATGRRRGASLGRDRSRPSGSSATGGWKPSLSIVSRWPRHGRVGSRRLSPSGPGVLEVLETSAVSPGAHPSGRPRAGRRGTLARARPPVAAPARPRDMPSLAGAMETRPARWPPAPPPPGPCASSRCAKRSGDGPRRPPPTAGPADPGSPRVGAPRRLAVRVDR
jgi:hypothetical protein